MRMTFDFLGLSDHGQYCWRPAPLFSKAGQAPVRFSPGRGAADP